MKIFLILLHLFFSELCLAELKQYPEDRTYTSQDRGLRPYRSLSLYKTGSFVLTFDDGPDPRRTPKILDILKKYNAKAVFFVLTSKLSPVTFPIFKRMIDEGHLVGSHGPTHDRAADLSREVWKSQTKQSFLELAKWYKLAGSELTMPYYRFPYGDYGTRSDYHTINALKEVSIELMGKNCIHMAFWDVDSSDWVPGMTPEDVAQNLIVHNEGGTYIGFKREGASYVKVPMNLSNPPGGGVILQHDIQGPTIEGLELFLQYAQERGLRIPRMDEVEEFRITKDCRL